MARSETSLAGSVCLALVVSGVDYGGAVAELLAPGGELGRIWTLSKPLTYRAIDALVSDGMITRSGTAPGRGRERTLLQPTRAGRSATRRWLAEPVDHLRDVRTGLLLKFWILEQMERPLLPLAIAQRERFAPIVASIIGATTTDVVSIWRREHAEAVMQFLDRVIGAGT
ncbi:MAG: PadR family transcriptional regulator [Actinobacteria bacterium]|nr:PadR family transcriptional regulator [Actinomycetota bacterium]